MFGKKRKSKTDFKKQAANEALLSELGLPVASVEPLLKRFDLQYRSENLSWHYHFFASWSLSSGGNLPGSILEIGTESGDFANFLGNIFPSKDIFTIDLAESSEKFKSEYGRGDETTRSEYLEKRSQNLAGSNVNFVTLDSTFILRHFARGGIDSTGLFDAIWVDGDHQNPQVTIDIIQSLALLKPGGFLLVDDVVPDPNFRGDEYVSNHSWKTLRHLESAGLVEVRLFHKRTRTLGLQKYLGHAHLKF